MTEHKLNMPCAMWPHSWVDRQDSSQGFAMGLLVLTPSVATMHLTGGGIAELHSDLDFATASVDTLCTRTC